MISYNISDGDYDSMAAKKLNSSLVNESSFDLGIKGVATAEGLNATKLEYWTINIPTGISGTCTGNITVAAVLN